MNKLFRGYFNSANCCYFAETGAKTNKRKIYKASFVDSITNKQSVCIIIN